MDASVSTGFQIVTRKGRKQSTTKGELQNSVGAGCPTGGRKVKKTTCNCLFSDTDEGSTVDSKELKDKPYHTKVTNHIEVCRSELVASTFWTEIQETFCCKQQCRTCKADDSDPDYPREEAEDDSVFQHKNHKLPSNYQDIVCYGIGNISCSPIARYQFAFLLMLVDFLKPQGNCYIYDPILAPLERRIATEKGLLEIEKNEECEREAKGKTLFFMIHCGKSMYNNVLKANWGLNLENVVLVGNSFKNYEERLPSRQLKAEAPYIYSILPYTTEIPVMNSFHHDDIFNDTSFHIFMRELLRTAPDSLWTERYESCIIDDSEIISKEKIKTYTGEM